MRISAKADYALRAAAELAGVEAAGEEKAPVKAEALASAQGIPMKFLQSILAELRLAGIVRSQRGSEGGWWLAKPAEDVTLADVVRAVEGPLATVRGQRPHELDYKGAAAGLQPVWIAVRASLRGVLEHVTLADLAAGRLPPEIARLSEDPEAWVTR